jgi:hypothetical protein
MTDWASDLTAADDHALPAPEPLPGFNETYAFFGYDEKADLAWFVHLQAKPAPWRTRLWIYLPGGQQFLHAVVEDPARIMPRPGGEQLHAECLEPFRRWRVRGRLEAGPTTLTDMRAKREPGPPATMVELDMDVEALTPVWVLGADDGSTPEDHGNRGFRVHHQQLMVGRGVIRIDGKEIRLGDHQVWRDHSRGPRTLVEWGTHELAGAWFEKQKRGLGLLRQTTPDGKRMADSGYVVTDGVMETAEIVEASSITNVDEAHPRMTVALRTRSGEVLRMEGTVVTQTLAAFGPSSWLAEGIARWTLNGETTHGICERSTTTAPATAAA